MHTFKGLDVIVSVGLPRIAGNLTVGILICRDSGGFIVWTLEQLKEHSEVSPTDGRFGAEISDAVADLNRRVSRHIQSWVASNGSGVSTDVRHSA